MLAIFLAEVALLRNQNLVDTGIQLGKNRFVTLIVAQEQRTSGVGPCVDSKI
jgi:hypothetical protein